MADHDVAWDYDAEIDALFEGLTAALPLLTTGRVESMGVALTDRVKERLIERHGKAAGVIVYNTGCYEHDMPKQLTFKSAYPQPPSGPMRLGRAVLRLLGRSQPEPEPKAAIERPRWMKMIRDRETEAERQKIRKDAILGRHRPEPLH